MVRLLSIVDPRSRIPGEVSTSWPHMLTRVNDVGVHRCVVEHFSPPCRHKYCVSCIASRRLTAPKTDTAGLYGMLHVTTSVVPDTSNNENATQRIISMQLRPAFVSADNSYNVIIHVKFWKCQCGRFIRKSEGLGKSGFYT